MLTRATNLILIAVFVAPTIPARADCGCTQFRDTTQGATKCCSAKPSNQSRSCSDADTACACSASQSCRCGDDCRCGESAKQSPAQPVPRPSSATSNDVVRVLLIIQPVVVEDPTPSCSFDAQIAVSTSAPTAQQVCAQLSRFLL